MHSGLLARGLILFDNNAQYHMVQIIQDLLQCWNWEVLDHPPYSPDMHPRDYNLFMKMKETLQG
jgi:hypothetical protein